MRGIPRLVGYSLAVSFFTMLIMSTFPTQIQLAYAGGKSPYESGRDHGCDDADISDPDDRYINQPEKGPSFHTDEFMRGYNDGYDECSDGDSDGSGSSDEPDRDGGGDNDGQPSGSGSINWEGLCISYGDLIGISSDECDQYAQGTQLTDAGEEVLACNLLTRVGPTVLGLDIAGIGIGSLLARLC